MSANTMPKVSVVVPIHNTERYLAACVESVLAQTVTDIEVILVDDGSTDGCPAIERAFAARDARVRVIEQPNLRQGAARNAGLRAARGEYVYFMDSDDLITPTLLEHCVAACDDGGLDFATFDSAGFLDDPDEERPELFSEICDRSALAGMGICDGPTFWAAMISATSMIPYVCWLALFRRNFLLDNALFFVEHIYFEDTDWMLRVFLAAERLAYLPEKPHRYRKRHDSTTHAGFNEALAASCFDMYQLLIHLYWAQADGVRRRMVSDTFYVLRAHFDAFATFVPSASFVEQTEAFVRARADDAVQRAHEADSDEVFWYLALIARIEPALQLWKSDYRSVMTLELAQIVLFGRVFLGGPAQRIGIYGTGKVCDLLLDAFAGQLKPVALFETDPPVGKTVRGYDVLPIAGVAGFDLDMVLVASTKYQEQMVQTAQSAVGNDVETLAVSRLILRIDDWLPRGVGMAYE